MSDSPKSFKDFTPALENIIDFRQVLATIQRRKWIVLGSILVFLAIGWCYTLVRSPIYQSEMLMQVNSNSNFNTTGNNGNVVVFSWGNSVAASQAKVIPSRNVIGKVVDQLELDIELKPRYFPIFGKSKALHYEKTNYANQPSQPLWGLSQYDWGGNKVHIKSFKTSQSLVGKAFIFKVVSDEKYQVLDRHHKLLKEGTVGKKLHIELGPYAKIDILVDTIQAAPGVEFYLKKLRKVVAINTVAHDLDVQAAEGSRDLMMLTYKSKDPIQASIVLSAVGNAAMTNQIEGQARQASKVLVFLHEQLPTVKAHLETAEGKLNHYLSHHNGLDLDTESEALMKRLLAIDTKIADAQLTLAQLSKRFTEKSYQMKDAQANVETLLQQREQLLTELRKLPQSKQQQVDLVRDAKVQENLYSMMLEKIQQYQLMRAGTIGTLSVVDDANIALSSVNMPANTVRALYGFIGLIVGLLYIFIEAYFVLGIVSPEQIEEKFGTPIISTIHESKMQMKQVKAFNKQELQRLDVLDEMDHADLSTESFRSLRTYLFFEFPDAKNNIIAIYGPTPNVGKSFASVNLAHLLSVADKKVLLIDGDIRRGNLHNYFDVDHNDGLCELVAGKVTAKQAIHKTRFDNLDFLPRGSIQIDHVELLMKRELEEALDALSKDYDFIVMDTAPVLAVSDALLIAPHVGTNLLVLGYGKHDLHELQVTFDRFKKARVEVKGFIFNRISDSYSYYGASKYNYRYHYSATDHKKA